MKAEIINQRKVKQFIKYIERNSSETWFRLVVPIGLLAFSSLLIRFNMVCPLISGLMILSLIINYYVTTKKILTLKFAIVAFTLGMLLDILIRTVAPYLTLLYFPVWWVIGALIPKFFK